MNAILKYKWEERIKEIKILNPYQVPKIPEFKMTILDIRAKNEKGEEL